MKVSARYALLTLFQSIGELPTGGADVRRSTFRKNANCYEAEAPRFSVGVVSPHLFRLDSRIRFAQPNGQPTLTYNRPKGQRGKIMSNIDMTMEDPSKNAFVKINEELQDTNDMLQGKVDEVLAELAKRPTEEEYANLQRDLVKLPKLEEENESLRSENADLQSQLESLDGLDAESLANLKELAKQGEAYLEIAREDAKKAFRTRLMADGVKRTEVNDHPEYKAHCRQLDNLTDLDEIQGMAESDYRSVRQSRRSGRASKELNGYGERVDGTKTNFSQGANDIR